ncbi:hypothetical protein EDB92DRAFT_1818455 [Lactarius akahatsu]|uniref:Uncharacterized protein n=1 Tax=Lactarius akahatsu TaxID=416441 RepID=A0AAD4LE40_9AGAM|nr:hypothetical protein EDB92DRAFT_1818455 [Lactarius akahatsu]
MASACTPGAVAIQNITGHRTSSDVLNGPSLPSPIPVLDNMLPTGSRSSPRTAPGPSRPPLSSAPHLGAAAEGEGGADAVLHMERDVLDIPSAICDNIVSLSVAGGGGPQSNLYAKVGEGGAFRRQTKGTRTKRREASRGLTRPGKLKTPRQSITNNEVGDPEASGAYSRGGARDRTGGSRRGLERERWSPHLEWLANVRLLVRPLDWCRGKTYKGMDCTANEAKGVHVGQYSSLFWTIHRGNVQVECGEARPACGTLGPAAGVGKLRGGSHHSSTDNGRDNVLCLILERRKVVPKAKLRSETQCPIS